MTFKNEGSICNHNMSSTTSWPFPSQLPRMHHRNGPFFTEPSFDLEEDESVQEGNHSYRRGAQAIPRSLRFAHEDLLTLTMVVPSPPSVRERLGHYPSSLCSQTTTRSTISEIIDIVLRIINEEEVDEDDHACSSHRFSSSCTPINGVGTRGLLDHEENGPPARPHHEDSGRSMQEGQHQQ